LVASYVVAQKSLSVIADKMQNRETKDSQTTFAACSFEIFFYKLTKFKNRNKNLRDEM
jgi:hypothetical protein